MGSVGGTEENLGVLVRRGTVAGVPDAQVHPVSHPLCPLQNIMPISAAMFSSERKNPEPQCPPRLAIQILTPVTWSRMPNEFLGVETTRLSERQGWVVECTEPLVMMALHIPEENRLGTPVLPIATLGDPSNLVSCHPRD